MTAFQPAKNTPYIHQRIVLFGETDAARIVYTPRFSDYCMEAAEVWFREYLDSDWYQMNAFEQAGTPVVHMELDFFSPLIGNDRLSVEVLVNKVSNSTVTLFFTGSRASRADEALDGLKSKKSFTAEIVFCFFSNQTERSKPIPEKQRKLLKQYQKGC